MVAVTSSVDATTATRSRDRCFPLLRTIWWPPWGALGRKCYVVPSLDLVVTRLGDNPHDEDFSNGLFEHLMKAAPR